MYFNVLAKSCWILTFLLDEIGKGGDCLRQLHKSSEYWDRATIGSVTEAQGRARTFILHTYTSMHTSVTASFEIYWRARGNNRRMRVNNGLKSPFSRSVFVFREQVTSDGETVVRLFFPSFYKMPNCYASRAVCCRLKLINHRLSYTDGMRIIIASSLSVP